MTRVIKADEVMNALRAESDRRGWDFVYKDTYKQCVYQERDEDNKPTGNPGCIAGGALILGLGLSFNAEYGSHIEGAFYAAQYSLEKVNDVKFTPLASLLLTVAQGVQDAGGTHGEAIDATSRVQNGVTYGNQIGVSDEVTA